MDMGHRERREWVDQLAQINRRLNDGAQGDAE
jgi:hypothetical protein